MIGSSAPTGATSTSSKHAWPHGVMVRKQLIGWRNGLVQKANVGKFGGAVGNVEMASTPTADLSSADRTSAAQLKGAIVETWEQAGDTSMLMWLEMLEEKHVEMYQNGAFLLSQVLERYPEGHPTPTAAKAAKVWARFRKQDLRQSW